MPYQSEARIVCLMVGGGGDVKVGGPQANMKSHPFFDSNPANQSLLGIAAKPMGQVPSVDMAACRLKAQQFVSTYLPAGYSLNPSDTETISITHGFAWRDGGWVITGATYGGFCFVIQKASEDVKHESDFKDPTGVNDQQLTLAWYVVIQPQP